jgi:hypothetical protein
LEDRKGIESILRKNRGESSERVEKELGKIKINGLIVSLLDDHMDMLAKSAD